MASRLALFCCLAALAACTKSKPKEVAAPVDAGTPTADHGKFASSIAAVRATLEKAPCDKRQALMLGDYLNRAHDYEGARAAVADFEKQCTPWPRLTWVRQHACEQLEDHACASKNATALIDSEPTDSDYWWWRGQAEAGLGHSARAKADFLQSMANKPTGFPAYRLAQLASEKLSKSCDPAFLIQWWIDHGKRTNEEWVDSTRTRVFLDGKCDRVDGSGTTTLAFPANAPVRKVALKVDGVAATFLLDEHAGTTIVAKPFFEKAKLPAPTSDTVVTLAVGTVREGPQTIIKKLQLGTASVTDLDAVVLDELPEGIDGVLGLNALMRFKVTQTAKGYQLAAMAP